jgi:thymidylate kinase
MKPVYICLEGVKGSGKTTLLKGLKAHLKKKGRKFQTANPTKLTHHLSKVRLKLESSSSFSSEQDHGNDFKEELYAKNSNYVGRHVKWHKGLIIGDRSIITSYATRWQLRGPEKCIARVNELETKIHAPDYVIYLNVSLETLQRRISKRENRKYGKYDETEERLKLALEAYQEIEAYPIERLSGTKWLHIDAEKDPQAMLANCIAMVDEIIKSRS